MRDTFLSACGHYGNGLFTDYMEALENSGSGRTQLSQYQRPAQSEKEGNKNLYICNSIALLLIYYCLKIELDLFLPMQKCH